MLDNYGGNTGCMNTTSTIYPQVSQFAGQTPTNNMSSTYNSPVSQFSAHMSSNCTNVVSPTFRPPVSQFAIQSHQTNLLYGSPQQNANHSQVNSFCLKWVNNTTVSRCYGCKGDIPNPPGNSAEALIVVYRDFRSFFQNGILRWTDTPENVHFHLNIQCIQYRYPLFIPCTLVFPPEFIQHFDEQQKFILSNNFGITL